MREHADWVLKMWEGVPKRPCDDEYALGLAAWHERNEPWDLTGLTALVENDLRQRHEQPAGEPVAVPSQYQAPVASEAGAAQEEEAAERPARRRQRFRGG